MDGKTLEFLLTIGATVSAIVLPLKMHYDFYLGKDSFFSRAYKPFFNLICYKQYKISDEFTFQQRLRENQLDFYQDSLDNEIGSHKEELEQKSSDF